jgi:hypothetical protein
MLLRSTRPQAFACTSAVQHFGSRLPTIRPPSAARLLWQVQYVVSQGMYAVLTFSSARDPEPNVASPQLFTRNWQNLWRMLADLPQYKHMKGRVLADLATDPSRWGCQVREFARAAGAPAGSQVAMLGDVERAKCRGLRLVFGAAVSDTSPFISCRCVGDNAESAPCIPSTETRPANSLKRSAN